jgi:hypothetical protein
MTAVHAIYHTPDQRARIAESLKQAYARHGALLEDAYCSFMFEVKQLGNGDLWRRLVGSKNIGEALVQWHRFTRGEDE